MPLPRLCIRTLMVVVGLVAVVLGLGSELVRRRDSCRERAALHRTRFLHLLLSQSEPSAKNARLVLWHEQMQEKYALAAHRPWLPVPPDPPEPE